MKSVFLVISQLNARYLATSLIHRPFLSHTLSHYFRKKLHHFFSRNFRNNAEITHTGHDVLMMNIIKSVTWIY